MIQGTHWLTLLVDPRGRLGRFGLLISATAMLGIEAFLLLLVPDQTEGLPVYLWPLKSAEFWIGTVAMIKRLHDIGKSGWWIAIGMGGFCMWSAIVAILIVFVLGGQAFQAGSAGYVMLLGILMLPALGVAFWLHLVPGDPLPNRFGVPVLGAPADEDPSRADPAKSDPAKSDPATA
jgi:uncharacterized membrane protein YhaH (DUF805 family)